MVQPFKFTVYRLGMQIAEAELLSHQVPVTFTGSSLINFLFFLACNGKFPMFDQKQLQDICRKVNTKQVEAIEHTVNRSTASKVQTIKAKSMSLPHEPSSHCANNFIKINQAKSIKQIHNQ